MHFTLPDGFSKKVRHVGIKYTVKYYTQGCGWLLLLVHCCLYITMECPTETENHMVDLIQLHIQRQN